jgi:Ca2+-transporting ATPase
MKAVSFDSLTGLERHDGGLNHAEVEAQRTRYGANDIVEVAGHPLLELLIDTIKDPMIWFLVGIGTVFLITGEVSDAITLFVAVLPLLLMDAVLHWRTQDSTASLRGQLSSVVRVVRSSQEVEIDSREIVPGDVIVLKPGLLLPADGVFEATKDIQVDESVLTGESLPITKKALSSDIFSLVSENEKKIPRNALGYAGTRVLTGHGFLRVLFTGSRTSYGEIVQSVARMPHERTPLQKSISKLVQFLIFAAVAFCFLLAGIRIYQGHGWLDAFLSAATLAVAAIPEEFPVVFTFFLGVGIYRLAKKRALVRKAVSVENIGRITQICTDKTGTITVGSLTLTHIDAKDGATEDIVLRAALIASSSQSDPVDIAIHEMAGQRNLGAPVRVQTMPFTEDRKRETGVTASSNQSALICVKGAPELVLKLCTLSSDEVHKWRQRISSWAKDGHKVIACAQVEVALAPSYQEPQSGFEFLGLLAFEDPARPEVAEAMTYCRDNAIRVLMITGDHPDTAAAIAKDAGISDSPKVISAEEYPEKFDETWLDSNPDFLKNLNVVARCTPLQKLRIVTALKRAGELVAVTGDGVNDVPALKAADIGIAMGERGTRSAKEVSSIILGDDNFRTIVNAIREGRQLFNNLQMSFEYLLLIHIPLVAAAALIPLADYPLVFLPIHIVWLELVIHPTALLSFQARAKSDQTYAGNKKTFFSTAEMARITIIGFAAAAVLGWSFFSAISEDADPNHARAKAMAFLTLWSAGVGVYLTKFQSRAANFLALLTVLSSVLFIQNSHSLTFLKLVPLHARDWLEIICGVILVLIISWKLQKGNATLQHPA